MSENGQKSIREKVKNFNPPANVELGVEWGSLNENQKEFYRMVAIKNSVSKLKERVDFGRSIGETLHGPNRKEERDYWEELGYPEIGSLTWDQYWQQYVRGGPATTIIEKPAKTTWKKPPSVNLRDSEDEFIESFNGGWKRFARNTSLWKQLRKGDTLARIGHYSVLLLGIDDGEDRFDQPVNTENLTIDDIKYIKPYAEPHAEVKEFFDSDKDHNDPRFGEPKIYRLDLNRPMITTASFDESHEIIDVHADRIILMSEEAIIDELYGRPALRNIWNLLIDLQKVVGPSAEAWWKEVEPVWNFEIDPSIDVDDDKIEEMEKDVMNVIHGLQRSFTAQGVKMTKQDGQIVDPTGHVDTLLKLIAASTMFTKTQLTGHESGERASSENNRIYLGGISERIEYYAQPIVEGIVERLQTWEVLPSGRVSIEWPALRELDDKEKAETAKTRGEAAQAWQEAMIGPLPIGERHILEDELGLPTEELMDISAQLDLEDQAIGELPSGE